MSCSQVGQSFFWSVFLLNSFKVYLHFNYLSLETFALLYFVIYCLVADNKGMHKWANLPHRCNWWPRLVSLITDSQHRIYIYIYIHMSYWPSKFHTYIQPWLTGLCGTITFSCYRSQKLWEKGSVYSRVLSRWEKKRLKTPIIVRDTQQSVCIPVHAHPYHTLPHT